MQEEGLRNGFIARKLVLQTFFFWVMSFSLTESLVYIELNKCYLLTKSGYNLLFVSDH